MPKFISKIIAWIIDRSLSAFVSFITGVRPKFEGDLNFTPDNKVYFANHASHGDFVMVWISLPHKWRKVVRPVAGADYWLQGKIRQFIIQNVFNALLIMRNGNDPKAITAQMTEAIGNGSSLIIFPEGTRNTDENTLLQPFKSGIYHLAMSYPQANFVPMWIDNINHVLPKGKFLPVPLLCQVQMGSALQIAADESKETFIERCHSALLALAPNR